MRLPLWIFVSMALLTGAASGMEMPARFGIATQDPFASDRPARRNGVLLFGGRYTLEDMGNSFIWSGPRHSPDYFIGVALTRDMVDLPGGFVLGPEAGLAARFGTASPSSVEVWGGARLKHHGLVFGDVNISPSVTLGMSVTSNQLAIESVRERMRAGSAQVLVYFTPELALRVRQLEHVEFVYRLQHRSGAFGAFGDITEGANANSVGMRWRF